LANELHAIVNPIAGSGCTRRRWPRLAATLGAIGWQVRSYVTSAPGDATRIARSLLHAGARELLSVGGDGTANEIANGFFGDGEAFSPEAVLSIMPTGTGHDFGRSVGIRDTSEAVAALSAGRVCPVDVGFADYHVGDRRQSRCFINAADVGIGAVAAAKINRSRKLAGGFLTYLFGAVRAIVTFQARSAQVVVDGATLSDGPISMVLIANGRFHAGGMRMAPTAQMADGFLEVLVLRKVSRLALLLSLLPRAYAGTHVRHPGIRYARGRDVQVRATGLPLEMDGEQPGTTDVRIRVLPRALRVRVPRANDCP